MHEPESVLTDEYVFDSFVRRAASLMLSYITSKSVEGRKLVEEITSLEARLSQLKGEYNAQASISKLPPEILSEIFLQQATSVREERVTTAVAHRDDNDPFVHKSFYSWLNVTHVCRHWREVSLNCVRLWTWLAFDPRCRNDVVEALLPRAQSLPLTFVVPLLNPSSCCDGCPHLIEYHRRYIRMLNGLRPLVPRLRELILLVEWEDYEDIWDVLATTTNTLESIRIETVGDSPAMREFSPLVPARLFSGS